MNRHAFGDEGHLAESLRQIFKFVFVFFFEDRGVAQKFHGGAGAVRFTRRLYQPLRHAAFIAFDKTLFLHGVPTLHILRRGH